MISILYKPLALALFIFGLATSSASSESLISPSRGEPLRKELLDTMRPRVEAEMHTRVQFVVDNMKVMGECAFVVATPQHKDGSPIAIAGTRFARDADFLDGLTTYSLMIHKDKRWHEVAFVTGPTDVAYETWPQDYSCPKNIFGLE